MPHTDNERAAVRPIADRIDAMRRFLVGHEPPSPDASAADWFRYLSAFKAVQGNAHNLLSLAACLLAKDYLESRFPMAPFDVSEKPQGAPGLDIDAATTDGRRIVGELKTTVPYGGTRLGAAQQRSVATDIEKLCSATASVKFFFVTDPATKAATQHAFAGRLDGIEIACLVDPAVSSF